MTETVASKAQTLYTQAQAAAARWALMGVAARGIQTATLEEITAHVATCDALSTQYRVTMDPAALWGKTADELQATALSKSRRNAGHRGAKALENKYGRSAAERIVYQHSGKHIR